MTARTRELNEIMEFEHVIEVHEDGTVTDAPYPGIWAPSYHDDTLDQLPGSGWTLMDGYSGQDRYSGPVMHNSEFIGGRMETDILEEPGYYVAIIATWPPDEDDDPDDYEDAEGWLVAYRPLSSVAIVDVFGLDRSAGQRHIMEPDHLDSFVASLKRDDRDFFEVIQTGREG